MRLPAEALSVTCTSTAGSHVPLPDVLGSVRILLDGGQNLTDGYAFEGFGSQVSGGGSTSNPYRYVGLFGYYEDQETGLVLLSRRYYDASVGRFLTRDPIDYAGGDWGLYGYVGGRPVGMADPAGLQCKDPCAQQKNHPTSANCQDCADDQFGDYVRDKFKDAAKEKLKDLDRCMADCGRGVVSCIKRCLRKVFGLTGTELRAEQYFDCVYSLCDGDPSAMPPGPCAAILKS